MSLNLTTLLPAKINTSEIATKYDVSSSIAAYNPATAINANTTTIDGGKITTGTITAGQIAANTITTNNLTTGITLVNGQVSSSDFATIGGGGFRLKSNADGTEADPTIYGAYIRGGTIDSSTMNVRHLKVIGDDGYNVMPFYIGSIESGFSSSQLLFSGTSFYPYLSSNESSRRLGKESGNTIFISENGIWCDSGSNIRNNPPRVSGYVPLIGAGYSNLNNADIQIKVGSTVYASRTSTMSNGEKFEIAGIGFVFYSATYYSYTYYFIGIREVNNNVSISSIVDGVVSVNIVFASSIASYDRMSRVLLSVNNMS
jgi:hypothetical protein